MRETSSVILQKRNCEKEKRVKLSSHVNVWVEDLLATLAHPMPMKQKKIAPTTLTNTENSATKQVTQLQN